MRVLLQETNMIIEFHRNMLADHRRNEAFYEALKQVIKPGKTTIADVGAGTGLLSFMAIKLGAKACHLYEYTEALKLAQKIARANQIRGCHFINQHSTAVAKPQKVDVVVSETLGNYALEENLIETMNDAKRMLNPGGILIPGKVQQFVAPVTSAQFYEELAVWDKVGFDLDFQLARQLTFNNLYVRTFKKDDLQDDEKAIQCWDTIDLYNDESSIRKRKTSWQIKNPTTIYGFALWWNCELVPGVELGNSPFEPPTHWEQLYLPLPAPLTLNKGDTLQLKLNSDTRYEIGVNLRWETTHLDNQGQLVSDYTQDMSKGHI
jgi:SAM-dependent methyltransferase